jgi:adenylate cyclase
MGDIPADYFAGKAVLIGPYTVGLQDQWTAAIDRAAPMYGVEFQANAVEAQISGMFKRELQDAPQLALLFLVAFGGFWWFWQRRMLPATLAFAAVAGGWALLGIQAYAQGYVVHILWIPLASAVAYVSCVAANYIREAMERRRVTSTFKRYVAPEIVGEILRGGQDALQLGGKLTDIAVLFVDIRGFTPMSELLEPPRVVEILNHYLTLTSSCIIRHGGTLDKFVGDATMAFWGAPLPQEDYTLKAARAALDMVEGSQALGAELLERYGRTVSFGIGIHCGKAVVGNIGAPIRMDYTAIGDTVNTAARLEANAPGGKVLISRAVADALGDMAKTTSLGDTIKLKGKSEGFEILTLDSLEEYHAEERCAV